MKYRHCTAAPADTPKTRSPRASIRGKISRCPVRSCNRKLKRSPRSGALLALGPAP